MEKQPDEVFELFGLSLGYVLALEVGVSASWGGSAFTSVAPVCWSAAGRIVDRSDPGGIGDVKQRSSQG